MIAMQTIIDNTATTVFVKDSVNKSLEKFDLESFQEYLYNQKSITFNSRTRRLISTKEKKREKEKQLMLIYHLQ